MHEFITVLTDDSSNIELCQNAVNVGSMQKSAVLDVKFISRAEYILQNVLGLAFGLKQTICCVANGSWITHLFADHLSLYQK